LTRWGILLLAAYIALGLSGVEMQKAVRYAIAMTAIVVVGVGLRHGAL
jgi:hypothetical protein